MSTTLTLPPARPVAEADYQQVLDIVGRAGVMVLTGAGMSTASGIPDYRGPDGQRRVTPMQYSEFLAEEAGRRRYWSRAYTGWTRFQQAEPNRAHYALADIERAGFLTSIVTQNVDGLHQRAGAEQVLELHGTLGRVTCLDCSAAFSRATVHRWLTLANPNFDVQAGEIRPDGDVLIDQERVDSFVLAHCSRCESNKLKPDVVFFGGSVPKPRVDAAYELLGRSRALLVVGSSLQVMSGYRFVRAAKAEGKPVVILTRGQTRGDADASVKVDALLADVLPRLTADLVAEEDTGRLDG